MDWAKTTAWQDEVHLSCVLVFCRKIEGRTAMESGDCKDNAVQVSRNCNKHERTRTNQNESKMPQCTCAKIVVICHDTTTVLYISKLLLHLHELWRSLWQAMFFFCQTEMNSKCQKNCDSVTWAIQTGKSHSIMVKQSPKHTSNCVGVFLKTFSICHCCAV